ncbi:hypothetical protein RA8CHR_05037 [Variovorax sp. RA8]|nr:hypothetical protein RA8CHR_05037 [Variovorax sp. RA8]
MDEKLFQNVHSLGSQILGWTREACPHMLLKLRY